MVVQGSHAKDPPALAVGTLGGFVDPHLENHRKGFGQEHSPHQQQRPEAVTEQGDGREGRPHGEGTRIPHEHPGRMAVLAQKAHPAPRHRHAEGRQGGVAPVAPQHQLQGHAGEDHGPTTGRQAIKAVGEVGGVAFGHEHKQPQRPDQQAKGQESAEGQSHISGQPCTQPVALPGPNQKKGCGEGLQHQLAAGAEARIAALGQAAPVINGSDRHEGQGDGGDRQQARISSARPTPD